MLRGYYLIYKSVLRMRSLALFILLIGLVTATIVVSSVESIDVSIIKMTESFPLEYKPHLLYLFPYNNTVLTTGWIDDWNYTIVEIGYLYLHKTPLLPVLVTPLEGWNSTGTTGVPPITISVPQEIMGMLNKTMLNMPVIAKLAPISISTPGLTNTAYWITSVTQTYHGGITHMAGLQPIVITTPLGIKIIEKTSGTTGITYKPLLTGIIMNKNSEKLTQELLEDMDVYKLEKEAYQKLQEINIEQKIIAAHSNLDKYEDLETQASVLSGFTSGFFIIPIMIANGTILYIASRLLVYSYRKWIALFASRGISIKKVLTQLFITILLLSLTGSIIGTLTPVFLLRYTHHIKLLYNLDPYMIILVPLAISILISGFSTYRLHRITLKKTKQEMIMNIDKIIEEEEKWRPNTFVKILFIISIISALMTIAGISVVDVFRYASHTNSTLITLLLTFTGIITTMIAPFSPLIITYYVIMALSTSHRTQTTILKLIEPLTGKERASLVKSVTSREMPTVSKITFIIAFIISIVTAMTLMKYNVNTWINYIINAKLVIGGMEVNLGVLTTLIGIGEALKHSLYWIAPVGFIVMVLGIATVILFSSMYSSRLEREATIFRARGATRKTITSFLYNALFPPILISLSAGLIIGYIWAKTFSSYFSLLLETITFGETEITLPLNLSLHTIFILTGLVILMVVIPLFSVSKITRKPIAESLRGIQS